MNDAEEALSSKARAITEEPSGAVIHTRHVMSNMLERRFIAAFDDTEVVAYDPRWSLGLG